MIALDLFAGTGWGVACQRLGIEEYGVEIMPEAVATREANGMHTIYRDVWEGLDAKLWRYGADGFATDPLGFPYDLLIASPPCQTFSMAGGGAGRKALDEVIEAIETRAYLDPARLRAFGEEHDPRTALVLTPLAHVARDVPLFVVFEQVPPVLPVWERCAEEMRRWGYSVWTGIVNAEQYGVPQTRRRAILIARADGKEAKPPTPTHSRYYSRDPKRLDPGVLPWVSMAEALGWEAGRAMRTNQGNPREGYFERDDDAPSPTVTGIGSRSWNRVMRSNYGTGGDPANRGEREVSEPAPTMTSKADRNQWRFAGAGATAIDTAGQIPREQSEPAHTVTGKGTAAWVEDRPATTIAGDSRVWPPGHKVNAADHARLGEDAANARYGDRAGSHAERVTVAEAAALQSYPPDFEWCGTKTKQFLQIGNAVPPLLAEAILKAAIS